MKVLLFPAILFVLAGCKSSSSTNPTPADPFLGHWQADSQRDITYDATGKQLSDATTNQVLMLDVTATTMTLVGTSKGGTSSTQVATYSRNGEALTFSGAAYNAKENNFARGLTANNFTLEVNGKNSNGSGYQTTWPFHR